MSLFDGTFAVAAAVGLLAAGGYVLVFARHRGSGFTLLDGLIVVAVTGVVTAVTMPLVGGAGDQAKGAALSHDLHALRSQIQVYKVEHGGQVPILYEGTLPQLIEATNAEGVPGPKGKQHPYGPYFRGAMPANPFTGVATITPTQTSPPEAPSGTGGWLYHQPTGQIWPDLAGHLGD